MIDTLSEIRERLTRDFAQFNTFVPGTFGPGLEERIPGDELARLRLAMHAEPERLEELLEETVGDLCSLLKPQIDRKSLLYAVYSMLWAFYQEQRDAVTPDPDITGEIDADFDCED